MWRFVNRFSSFYRYEAVVKTLVDGEFENWPVAASYIRRKVGSELGSGVCRYPQQFRGSFSLSMMPALVYDKFVKGLGEAMGSSPPHAGCQFGPPIRCASGR